MNQVKKLVVTLETVPPCFSAGLIQKGRQSYARLCFAARCASNGGRYRVG